MEESRTQRLHQLLKRLGQAVHGSVLESKEVRACLEELHGDGWDGVMILEASFVSRSTGELESENAAVRIHVDPETSTASYRIDASDASLLSSLGISSDRHRSKPTISRPDPDDESGWQDD
jgi:hypothetical protein